MHIVPARLHVLLARDASTGVVIRRGPSRQVAVIGWDRTSDRFKVGQWLHGRIYERRCDLSPDGRHLIYFAMNGRWHSRAKGAWTALSKAPYLKALTLLAKGDCWNGGGLFLSSKEYWLNGCGHEVLHDDSRLKCSPKYPWHEAYGGECPGVYYVRLQRDGWAMKYTAPDGRGGAVTVFEKRVTAHWILRKRAFARSSIGSVGRGCYFDEHELRNSRTEATLDFPKWEWADIDNSRLVWAEDGKLFSGRLDRGGLGSTKELYDFNTLRFERLAAPY